MLVTLGTATCVLSATAPHRAHGSPDISAPAPSSASGSPTLASFEGGAITVADLQSAIALRRPASRAEAASPEGRKRMLDELVSFDLLVLEAERRGYAKHATVQEAVKKRLAEALIAGPLALDPASISKEDVEAHYAAHRDSFRRAEMRRARHVVLATEAEAKQLIAKLSAQREKAVVEISKVAREQSLEATTRRQSGELGFFSATGARAEGSEQVRSELVKAAFALRAAGDVSPKPVPTEGGFSVLVLVLIEAAFDIPLSDAEENVRGAIATERARAAVDAVIAQQRAAHPTVVHAERLAQIALEPAHNRGLPQGFRATPADPREPPKLIEPDGY